MPWSQGLSPLGTYVALTAKLPSGQDGKTTGHSLPVELNPLRRYPSSRAKTAAPQRGSSGSSRQLCNLQSAQLSSNFGNLEPVRWKLETTQSIASQAPTLHFHPNLTCGTTQPSFLLLAFIWPCCPPPFLPYLPTLTRTEPLFPLAVCSFPLLLLSFLSCSRFPRHERGTKQASFPPCGLLCRATSYLTTTSTTTLADAFPSN